MLHLNHKIFINCKYKIKETLSMIYLYITVIIFSEQFVIYIHIYIFQYSNFALILNEVWEICTCSQNCSQYEIEYHKFL